MNIVFILKIKQRRLFYHSLQKHHRNEDTVLFSLFIDIINSNFVRFARKRWCSTDKRTCGRNKTAALVKSNNKTMKKDG